MLEELENRPADKADMLAWFNTLPLAVEGESWRCVHACWHPESLAALEHHDGRWFIPEHRWVAAARKGSLRPERPNAACADYSAGRDDKLAAYRLGSETTLRADGFCAEPVQTT